MSDPVVVKLRQPVILGSQTVTELVLRAPKGKDFRSLPVEPNFGDLIDFAGRLSGQTKPVMDELSAEDLSEVLKIVGDFVPGGPGTGTTT